MYFFGHVVQNLLQISQFEPILWRMQELVHQNVWILYAR